MSKPKAIIVSGYFNPIHKDYLKLHSKTRAIVDKLIAIINNDNKRVLEGSKEFQDENDCMIIVYNIKAEDKGNSSLDTDKTDCATIKMIAE